MVIVGLGTSSGGEFGEGEGDGFSIAEGHEGALDAGAAKGRKEVSEIHFQDHVPSSVGFGKVDDAVTLAESGGRFMGWNFIEEVLEEKLLRLFEKWFGRF